MDNTMFSPETYDLGDLKIQHSADAVFIRQAGGLPIKRIEVSCGCTSYQQTDTQLRVSLSIAELPDGVREEGRTSFTALKTVTVVFSDDTFQSLYVAARISQ